MGKWNLWLSGLVLGLGVAACEVLHESDFYSSEVGVWFDPQMPPPSRQALLETYQFLNQLELDTTEVAHFSDIFGGHGTSALTNFLSERVHYFLGPDSPVSLQISGQHVELPGPGPGVVARNMGAFFLAEARDVGAGLELFIGETKVPASTFGAGYLQLSQLFFLREPAYRLTTLVHEARHSDCYGTHKEVCGHQHVKCPSGHPLDGELSCDDNSVGANYLTALVAKLILDQCSDCSSSTKHVLRQEALWSLMRVVNLQDIERGASHLSFSAEPFVAGGAESLPKHLRKLLTERVFEVHGEVLK